MMTGNDSRREIAEKSFVIAEERAFHSRARADREVGRWIAGRLGLSDETAERFAAETVEAGVRSANGRGGFDRLAETVARAGVRIEELRTRYAIAMAAGELPPGFFGAALSAGAPRPTA